jgi:hypothetical protein
LISCRMRNIDRKPPNSRITPITKIITLLM